MVKPFFPFSSKAAAFLWTTAAAVKRMMVLVFYFAPGFGLFDLLHHWQLEQIPFAVRKHRNVTINDVLHLRNIEPMLWSKVDRWNYFDDLKNPTPPPYTLYTGYSIGEYQV